MSEVAYLQTDKARHITDARNVLVEAAGAELEAVVVIGVKDGRAYAKSSMTMNMLQLLGCCELAKDYLKSNFK